MAALEAPFPVRIAKIAGRFLVFEPEAVASLRRQVNLNGVLVGTAPQQPTQNIFLGLPIELRPEEVNALVQQDAAYVVDDTAAHKATLRSFEDPAVRQAYVESLREQRLAAQLALNERQAQKSAEVAELMKKSKKKTKAGKPEKVAEAESPATPRPSAVDNPPSISEKQLSVTLTSSSSLISQTTSQEHIDTEVKQGPLCQHLQTNGYHMTPGLRFGSNYSVYPGDPLRFHAHFMANEYRWDEEVPVLDLVGGGRLATAVKKAFLVGGEQPATDTEPAAVRTFSIEWAAM
ncbi:hypothetical protein VHEMI10626 [[Torrubiella] hemipterigena]|uniref:tRNA-splicing endonuclease subunit Sen34 n=1 Tax=[Torrubiella] hemipterigena TaxID=1531966 RepID=A0A0A1TSJ3_9HYPO|nr:hypothetical protein VHEMI10626 [[Torrubiella] hemipterigena]